MKTIPANKWEWFGSAAHFICGRWCRFHMATKVGKYIVSTVGEYVHPRHSGANENTEREWMVKNPNGEKIGYDRFYETMVFVAGARCESKECGCRLPEIASDEKWFKGYNDRKAATEGHMRACKLAASGKIK